MKSWIFIRAEQVLRRGCLGKGRRESRANWRAGSKAEKFHSSDWSFMAFGLMRARCKWDYDEHLSAKLFIRSVLQGVAEGLLYDIKDVMT